MNLNLMKTNRVSLKTAWGTVLALLSTGLLAVVISPIQAAQENPFKGGASKLMMSGPVVAVATAPAVSSGKMGAMTCPQCRDVTVTSTVKTFKGPGNRQIATVRHLCPGCESRWETTGHGKAKVTRMMHTCKDCGSQAPSKTGPSTAPTEK
jgi:hypothetical protein